MSKQIEVTRCGNCPFYDFAFYACKHPDFPIDECIENILKIPDYCPLKKEPITISLKQDNNQ
jgi:hypothetical protein